MSRKMQKEKPYSISLSADYVKVLLLIATQPAITAHQLDKFFPHKAMYSNYTKLKHWGFIFPVGHGQWVMTLAGFDFLHGQTEVAETMEIYEDNIVATYGSVHVMDLLNDGQRDELIDYRKKHLNWRTQPKQFSLFGLIGGKNA